jgi:hypothetical protein
MDDKNKMFALGLKGPEIEYLAQLEPDGVAHTDVKQLCCMHTALSIRHIKNETQPHTGTTTGHTQ